MKTTKLTALILAAVFGSGSLLAGCGTTEEIIEAETVEVTPEVEEEVTIQEIGDPTASIEIMLTNEMGSAITGMSIKSPMETRYPANMMTANQKIANDETVKLFYEPVTEEDVEPEEGKAVKPDSSYVGFWNETGYNDCELTIYDVSDDTVTFHIWWYHTASTDDSVVATFDSENVGTFSTSINDSQQPITGTILFYEDSVVVNFDESEDTGQVPTGTWVFDERHDTSWEEGESFTLDQGEDTDNDSEEFPTDESTYTLQVTMENGDVYEFHDFDVEDMEEVTLYLEDEVAFIEYISLSQNVLINTKEAELQIKADKEEAQTNRDEARDEKAYEAGYYCGDMGYTKEDAEDRAAELGYKSGSKSYQDFWDGYNDGLYGPYHTDGDNYAIGYNIGLSGYSEEEARTELGADADPKSQYTKDFWNGYYAGYAEFEAHVEGDMPDSVGQLGMENGYLGRSLEEANANLWETFGFDSSSQYYQDFLNGYYYGLSEYEKANSQEEYETEEEVTQDDEVWEDGDGEEEY